MAAGTEKGAKYVLVGGPRETGARRTNLILNPGAEKNHTDGGWVGSLATVTRTTTNQERGAGGFQLTSTAAGGNMGIRHLGQRFAVTEGLPYSASAYFKAATVARNTRVYLDWYDAASVRVFPLAQGADVLDGTGGFTLAKVENAVAPAGAVTAQVIVEAAAVPNGEVHYIDSVIVAQAAAVPAYFDGDTPGYYWTGTPHASISAQNGTRVCLNDEADPDYVGVVTDITGLDSAEVVESVEENIESDGATHGRFFSGRRPVVLESLIYKHSSVADRNTKLQRLTAATNALRSDGVIRWTPQGYEEMFCQFRKQQKTNIQGAWNKQAQVSLICADPRIQSVATYNKVLTASGSGTAGRSYDRSYNINYDWAPARGSFVVTNTGDGNARPIVTLSGDLNNPAIQNVTTEQELSLNIDMASTDTLVIDFSARTLTLNGNTALYSPVEMTRSWWWDIIPGNNTIQLLAASFTGSPTMTVEYRNTWL